MDVEKSSRASAAFRESCRAAIYTVLLMSSPITIPAAVIFVVEARFRLPHWGWFLLATVALGISGIGLSVWLPYHREQQVVEKIKSWDHFNNHFIG